MGVQGLLTYITEQTNCLKRHKLRNTKVVVDGLNILHFLYHHLECPWVFSGEYDMFASRLRTLFNKFKECQLELYFIFDGCKNKSLNKEEVLRSRALQRLNSCHELNKQHFKKAILPNLAFLTFLSVLDEFNVYHLTCPEEADNEMAALANHLNCPVLSNDSDFAIFELTEGFIRLSSLCFTVRQESCDCCASGRHSFLLCDLFKQSDINLPNVNQFQTKYMPLLATLVGNDYVKKTDLSTIVDKIDLPKMSKRSASNPKQATKIIVLLEWLHNYSTVDAAVDKVVSYMKEGQRDYLRTVIQQSIQQYSTENAWILGYLKVKECGDCCQEYFTWLPEKLQTDFYNSYFKNSILSAIHAGQVYLSTFVEDVSQPSIHHATEYLRYIFYSLYRPGEKNEKVIEYIRHEHDYKKFIVEFDSLKDYKLVEINKSNFLDLLKISMDSVPFEEDSPFYTLIAITKCWLSLTGLSVKIINRELIAILLTAFYLIVQSNRVQMKISSLTVLDLTNKLKRFMVVPILNRNHPLDVASIHFYNQLQFFYNFFYYLNRYFGCLFKQLNPQDIFSGRLFFNLLDQLLWYPEENHSLSIAEILGRNTNLSSLFGQLFSVFDDSLDPQYFEISGN